MTVIRETAELHQPQAVEQRRYRSHDEIQIRAALEAWCRARWPDARIVHELVVDRGTARADVAAVGPQHLVAFEIKSRWDTVDRLMKQAALFRLAAPELWIVVDPRWNVDCDLIRYLMPSIGHLTWDERSGLSVVAEPGPWQPHPVAMLSLLWRNELYDEAVRARLLQGKRSNGPTHAKLVELMAKLELADQLAAVCRQLRGRAAFWRADPPVSEAA